LIAQHLHLLHPKYRSDIDGLRAVAVLSVLIFHTFPEWLSGGFIGVDVFFVISGYLISTIIFENIEQGRFSFLEFYSRRINRIFPALFVVLLSSYAFGWLNLLADDFAQLGKHIAGGAGFVSNLVLWSESGYFDKAAELKPLLHLWSLGIEEQFYFVWPLFIWWVARWPKKVLSAIVIIALISFSLNIINIGTYPVATFYSPLTRFWELLIGSLLAYGVMRRGVILEGLKTRYQNALSALGLILILIAAWVLNQSSTFQGWWALMPTIGAALIIGAGTTSWCNQKILSHKLLVWFGLISFPLYLWHWPLLAFARLQEGETPSPLVRVGLVLLLILLAWLTYRFVERPIRFGASYRVHKNIALIFLMILVGYLGYNCFDRKGIAFRHKFFMKEISGYTFDKVAEQRQRTCFLMDIGDDVNNFSTQCIHDDRPFKLVLWGDSHGGSIYPGFSELEKINPKIAVSQFTAAGCGGLVATEEQGPFCKRANEVALKEILKLKPNLVVIYKAWHPSYFAQIGPTVEILKRANIQVLIIGPTPRWKDDLPKIVYRYWKKHKQLPPPYYAESLEPGIEQMDRELRKIASQEHILYYSAYDRLCNADGCLNRIPNTENALTTLDEDHITPAAGRYIVEGLNQEILIKIAQ
jgi:peptidoglycan/LPS O-acetylase OafA/YrhL